MDRYAEVTGDLGGRRRPGAACSGAEQRERGSQEIERGQLGIGAPEPDMRRATAGCRGLDVVGVAVLDVRRPGAVGDDGERIVDRAELHAEMVAVPARDR